MAEFRLPKNSRPQKSGKVHKAEGAAAVKKFKVYRYDPDSGQTPRYDNFEIDTDACGPMVLDGLSLAVRDGERVALVGPSGAGKSTGGALLQGQLVPSSGRVVVGGVDASADPAAARARLAVVE